MFNKVSFQDWENLVKKQLKTENIAEVLVKENLEGIVVKPYYDNVSVPLKNLPKIEESTHLVARYQDDLHDHAYAFLVENSHAELNEKTIFVSQNIIFDEFKFSPHNTYFSLSDVFNDLGEGTDGFQYHLNKIYAEKLLAQPYQRNIAINVVSHQNAGASVTQQLAIALAKAKDLAEVFGAEILKKLVFNFAIGGNYFFEIAKIRAFKLLFNQLSQEFDLQEIPYIFAETSLRNKAKNDEENNLIRSTLELSAAMIGGADAVFAHDYKLQNSTTLSEEISFKQQIVLAYESIINVFEDAANGSYFVEDCTQQFAKNAWKLFLDIEENGGYVASLQKGMIQKMIYQQAITEQNWVEEGKIKLIGVNLYPKLEKTKTAENLYSQYQIKPVRWAEMFE